MLAFKLGLGYKLIIPATRETEVYRAEAQVQSGLQREYQVSLKNLVRHFLKSQGEKNLKSKVKTKQKMG